MDRLTEMEAFTAVVDQGGFTDAARKMGLSKSAISKHVAALETRLGTRLLNRTTRRVAPTELGLAYYGRVRRLLVDMLDADALVAALDAAPAGELRLLIAAEFGLAHVVPLVTSFLAEHPGVSVKLALDDALASDPDAFDLTIRLGDAAPGRRVLARFRRPLVAAPSYLQRAGRPLRIDDLGGHALLHATTGEEAGAWRLVAATGECREVRRSGPFAASSARALRDAAEAGLGIARLPGFLVAELLADGRLDEVLADLPPETGAVVATCRERVVPSRVRLFLDHLEAGLVRGGAAEW